MMKSESTTNNHFDLTQSAIRHFSSLLRNKDNQNIRIGIRDSGCSGYAYFLEFSEIINSDDLEFNFEAFNVLIDEKSITFFDICRKEITKFIILYSSNELNIVT